MKFEVSENLILKTDKGNIELRKGQIVEMRPEQAGKLGDKIKPLPYVTDYGSLVIPCNSPERFRWWQGGQSVCDTLKEWGRCDLIPKYKSLYSDN